MENRKSKKVKKRSLLQSVITLSSSEAVMATVSNLKPAMEILCVVFGQQRPTEKNTMNWDVSVQIN